jgi:hypothetical protein
VADRISKTGLLKGIGKMPTAAFEHLIASGVLFPPDGDGRWDRDSTVFRMAEYKALASRTRSVARRVILLNLEADQPVALTARRQAVQTVLATIRPLSQKMLEVRMELGQSRPRPLQTRTRRKLRMRWPDGRSRDAWGALIHDAPDATFDREWRSAVLVARRLTQLAESKQVVVTRKVPAEERFILVLIRQLFSAASHEGQPLET